MSYLSILIIIFLLTLFFEFKFRIHLYHSMKERIAVTLTILLFSMLWDYYAVSHSHWVYPGTGIVGFRLFGLPIEDFLFFLIVPYAVLTVYKFYDARIK